MSMVPVEFGGWPDSLPYTYGPYRAIVRYIVDGDTFDVLMDMGMNVYSYHRVRLLAFDGGVYRGVNAPEKNRAASKEAGLAARDWVIATMPSGSPVLLWTEKDPDEFGRYLAAVELADGRDLGTELVASGHGIYQEF